MSASFRFFFILFNFIIPFSTNNLYAMYRFQSFLSFGQCISRQQIKTFVKNYIPRHSSNIIFTPNLYTSPTLRSSAKLCIGTLSSCSIISLLAVEMFRSDPVSISAVGPKPKVAPFWTARPGENTLRKRLRIFPISVWYS